MGHKKICESLAIACRILYLCMQTKPKNMSLVSHATLVGGGKTAQANQYDCDSIAK